MSQLAVEVFISYAHEDEVLRGELANHLRLLERRGVIKAWHDRNITAGEEWKSAIDSHLESAKIILLLISADFLDSDYCYDIELKRALERHESKEACVIPVILRPVDWRGSDLEKLTALPKDGRAITSWPNQDEAFKDVVEGLRRAIDSLTGQNHQPTPAISGGNDQVDPRRSIMPLWSTGLLMSLGVTAAISVLRFTGVLQPLELKVYDYTMRSRPAEIQDDKILVIEVDGFAEPDASNRKNTLSDDRLDQLLELILPYEPKIIGFDNFLDHRIDPQKHQTLDESLRTGNLVAVCQAQVQHGDKFKAPDNAISVGFGDIVVDKDRVVRRHLLSMKFDAGFCTQPYALSALLANQYLEQSNQKLQLEQGKVGTKRLNFLGDAIGGYRKLDPDSKKEAHGYQVMLNYRFSGSLRDGVNSSSINDIFKLPKQELAAKIKDHIVIIGTTKSYYRDVHETPYGEIPGVFLQAQMTSQLVNAAMHNRPLIWAYPFWGEIPLILLASVAGALLSWRVRKPWILLACTGGVIVILLVGSVGLLTVVGYWFPLVPAMLGLSIGCIYVTFYLFRETKQE
jgi:CHASE2 domain-containing sensor protein